MARKKEYQMNKEDKCIVMGCRNKKNDGLNICRKCFDYYFSGIPNNSKASKNDKLNIEIMENQKTIDKEIDRINEINRDKQITMDYNNDEEKDD